MSERKRKPINLGIIGGLLVLPFFLLVGLFSIPWAACAIIYNKICDERFFTRMKTARRVIVWSEVERHLNASEGTLIIDHANKIFPRFWWTSDDIASLSPMPVIKREEGLGLSYVTGKTSDPFVSWCFENYLSGQQGKAFLTRLQQIKLPPGPVKSEFFLSLYPRANIVHTLRALKSG